MNDQTRDERPRLGVLLGAVSDAEADEFEELAASTLALLVDPVEPPTAVRDALLARIAADTSGDTGTRTRTTTFLSDRASVTLVTSAATRTASARFLGLPPAPAGKTYQVWFIRAGRFSGKPRPLPAGTFDPHGSSTELRIDRRYRDHDVVAVTIEPVRGSRRPTTEPLFAIET